MAHGLGAEVLVLDIDAERLRAIDLQLHSGVRTIFSSRQALAELIPTADLVVGAVLSPGAKAPKLIGRDLLVRMRPGSVLVDIAIDQGGCAETSRPTTHESPVYTEAGVQHYCVTNMPGAFARTATQALTSCTMPYVLRIAAAGPAGLDALLDASPELCAGLNTRAGRLLCPAVRASMT
jgi:alanine dehydrogenase